MEADGTAQFYDTSGFGSELIRTGEFYCEEGRVELSRFVDYPQEIKVEQEVKSIQQRSWTCFERREQQGERMFTVASDGFVGFNDGTFERASHEREGLDLRWDWGLTEDGRYKYSITLGPNGVTAYRDFSWVRPNEDGVRLAKPSTLYYCEPE